MKNEEYSEKIICLNDKENGGQSVSVIERTYHRDQLKEIRFNLHCYGSHYSSFLLPYSAQQLIDKLKELV